MYLGGDTESANSNTYFYGQMRELAIWSDYSLKSFPLSASLDTRNRRHNSPSVFSLRRRVLPG